MKIVPLFDRVVVKAVEQNETSKGGILLPNAAQEKQEMAVVIACGPGGLVDGKEVVMQVKEGDTVLYSKYSGSTFKVDGKEVTIIRQNDILAIVK